MSRKVQRLRDWPECLKQLSVDELRRERSYWQIRLRLPDHPEARKSMQKQVRDVEKELDRKLESDSS